MCFQLFIHLNCIIFIKYIFKGYIYDYSLKPQNNLNPELIDKINAVNKELTRTGIALDTVLKRYGVDSIEGM